MIQVGGQGSAGETGVQEQLLTGHEKGLTLWSYSVVMKKFWNWIEVVAAHHCECFK